MYRIVRRIDFCYGHRLLGHAGKCRDLHGHNGRAEVVVEGEKLNELGILVDFADLGREVEAWIGENLDHRTLLRRDDPLVPVLQGADQPLYLMDANPTAEEIARLLFEKARERRLPVAEVRLWETPDSLAIFTPR